LSSPLKIFPCSSFICGQGDSGRFEPKNSQTEERKLYCTLIATSFFLRQQLQPITADAKAFDNFNFFDVNDTSEQIVAGTALTGYQYATGMNNNNGNQFVTGVIDNW
jgi:hypothetical protein